MFLLHYSTFVLQIGQLWTHFFDYFWIHFMDSSSPHVPAHSTSLTVDRLQMHPPSKKAALLDLSLQLLNCAATCELLTGRQPVPVGQKAGLGKKDPGLAKSWGWGWQYGW